jgi:alpha-methylacyl-CoA racemase
MEAAPNHPHNVARATFVDTDGILQPGPAPRFSTTPADPPTHGDAGHTTIETVLARWS